MKRYAIALGELGLNNRAVLRIIESCSKDELKKLFQKDRMDIINSKVELFEYKDIFGKEELITLAVQKANDILKRNKELQIRTTYWTSKTYPSNLLSIDNPPAVLYYKGNL